VRNNTRCPTFLFANAGPWFVILGGVFTDKVIVQRLTDYIWIGMDAALNDSHCERVAKIMQSLRNGVRRLREYYAHLQVITVSTREVHPRYVPSICSYLDETKGMIEFEYIKPLEFDATCVTFLAHSHTDPPKQIVVKFVTCYGWEAHDVLAEKNLAPKLLYFGMVGVRNGDPTYRGLKMVVMEYIDGITLEKAKALRQVPSGVRVQIKSALDILPREERGDCVNRL
jgi:hypothetical protein